MDITFLGILIFIVLSPILMKFFVIHYLQRFGFFVKYWGVGFVLPFYFVARNFYIKFSYKEDYDYFELSCKKIRFFINPLQLFKKKLVIQKLYLEVPYLYYENKYNSYRKIQLLPKFNQIVVRDFTIKQGKIYTIDCMLPGPYQFYLSEINCFIRYLDLAVPVGLLFYIQNGKAKIDSGFLEIQTQEKALNPTGSLIMKNIKWTSIVGISIPFIGTAFDLFVYFTHQSPQEMLVKGYLHILGTKEENKEEGVPFQFLVKWEEFRLPIDLGLQKLIEKIFETINPSLLQKGIIYIGKEVFDRIKKVPEI